MFPKNNGDCQLSVDNMNTIRKDLDLSQIQTRRLARDLRVFTGERKIVEKDLAKHLVLNNHQLDLFHYQKHGSKTIVYCKDIQAFFNYIIQYRGLQAENCLLKVG